MTTEELLEWVQKVYTQNDRHLTILKERYEKSAANGEAQTAEKLRKSYNAMVETQEVIDALCYNLHDVHKRLDLLKNAVLATSEAFEGIKNTEKRKLIHGPFENKW